MNFTNELNQSVKYDFFDTSSSLYVDCVNYITNKIDLDCLINKNIFQWNNYILYILIASYLILTLYPIYKNILIKNGLYEKYDFNPVNIAHTMISISIVIILYLENRLSIIWIVVLVLITTLIEWFIDKKCTRKL